MTLTSWPFVDPPDNDYYGLNLPDDARLQPATPGTRHIQELSRLQFNVLAYAIQGAYMRVGSG